MKQAPKPKKVNYEVIERDSVIGHPMYALLDELVSDHHNDLLNARIALAWNLSWAPDVDGRVTLGKCKKASDLDREPCVLCADSPGWVDVTGEDGVKRVTRCACLKEWSAQRKELTEAAS